MARHTDVTLFGSLLTDMEATAGLGAASAFPPGP